MSCIRCGSGVNKKEENQTHIGWKARVSQVTSTHSDVVTRPQQADTTLTERGPPTRLTTQTDCCRREPGGRWRALARGDTSARIRKNAAESRRTGTRTVQDWSLDVRCDNWGDRIKAFDLASSKWAILLHKSNNSRQRTCIEEISAHLYLCS